jgi:zinc protease
VRSFGIALTTGRTVEDVEAWPERIAAVTASDVNEAAAYVLRAGRSVTGRLEPAAAPDVAANAPSSNQPAIQ